MNGGVKAALLVSCVLVGGCSATTSAVKVRAIADPSAAISRGGDEIAVARGQLMLGNVGLALEAFRKAQRANPSDPAALAGIGDCYAAMGRFDIAQPSYEAALALSPHDPRLLLGLAAVFERSGQAARAAEARAEAAATRQSIAPAASQSPAPVVAPSRAPAVSIAAAEPPAEQPHAAVGSLTVELPPATPAEHVEARSEAELAAPEIVDDVPTPAPESEAVSAPPPLPRPRNPLPVQNAIAVVVAPPPRLERLSSGEVALVTTAKPLWRPAANVRTAAVSSVRWVALAGSSGKPNVQVLNAARSRGLAASARTVLSGRGWRRIAIGDAPVVQHTSMVLYPKSRASLGRRLAAQFGVVARMAERDDVVLILGSDSVGRIGGQRRS